MIKKNNKKQLILSGLFSEVKVFIIGHKSSSKLDPAFSNSDSNDITDFIHIHECVYMHVYIEKLQVRYRHLVKDVSGMHIWERARSRRWRAAAVWNKNCKFTGAYCSFLGSPFWLGIQEFKTHPHFGWCLPLLMWYMGCVVYVNLGLIWIRVHAAEENAPIISLAFVSEPGSWFALR